MQRKRTQMLLACFFGADPSFASEADRVQAFIEQGGGCRTTYYNHAKKLPGTGKPSKIQLRAVPPHTHTLDASLLDLLRRRFKDLGEG